MWLRGEDAPAWRQSPTGLPAISSVVPVPVSEGAEKRAEEEVLLALRMMCQSGLRHPLHGHSYSRYTALRPRVCSSCEAPVFGPFSKACLCLTCGIIVHRQCVQRITRMPCGSFRGLHDPEGLNSCFAIPGGKVALKIRSNAKASVAGPEVVARSERKIDTDALLGGQIAEAEEEEVALNTGVRVLDSIPGNGNLEEIGIPGNPGAADAASSPSVSSSPSDDYSGSLTLTTGSGARRMTYDALARIGALVGSMVGVGGDASVGDGKEAAVIASGSSSVTSRSIFSLSALRGAGAVADAYTGYRQQDSDRRHGSIGGSHERAARTSPVAMAWSRLAQRASRPEGGGGGEGGAGALLDLATFTRTLEEKKVNNDESIGPRRRSVEPRWDDSSAPFIGQILRSSRTPPGFVWAACLDSFVARHAASAGAGRALSPDIIKTNEEEEGEDRKETRVDEEGGVPAGSCCEDAASIIHEVALVLMEYVPGLLGSSLEAYEEAFEAVETEIMTTLYPSVLWECQNQVRALSRAVEAWYRQQPAEQEEEEKGLERGGVVSADAHYHKAAQELIRMSREVTGRKKVQRVLGACLALGEGNLVMTADELLPALGRVVRLARVPALPAHLAFIEETCDTGTLLGAEGYALTSLQVVISLIITPPAHDDKGAEEGGEF
ncbi:vps9 domain-containing protein 1 [Nannochloropsis oceanica]